jgi:hypothetical protein
MTQENIFKEIEEDLERQKYEDLWKRYGIHVIAAALAIVLGTAGYNFWSDHVSKAHQSATGELEQILGETKADQAKQVQALQDFAERNQGQAQSAIARLHAAAVAARQEKKDEAIHIYDSVAADSKADTAFRQLADLLSVEIQIDSGDVAQLLTRLQPLITDQAPWRFTAMEYSGYLALRAGDKVKAKQLFTDLSQNATVPESLRDRAADILRLLAV